MDHIIPYSRCFDDSYQNKVLVLASENRQKGNRLPYEYFGQDEVRWHGYEVRVENLIHNYRKRQKLLKRRLTEEESTGFIDRNLKDTQYITRAVYNLIRDHLAFAESAYRKKPVQAVNGAVTSMLRGRWGVQKIREDGDLHHCLDAAVIAATTPGLVQRLTAYNKHRETWERPPAGYVDPATGELIELPQEARRDPFPKPWERFRQELEARLDPIDPRHQIDLLKLETYESDEEIKPVFVSRMPNHKVTGAAHAETIRSSKGGDGFTVTKTPLANLKLNKFGEIEGYYNPASDTLLYDALLARLKAFGGDGAKAFAQPFYKPKKDGTLGPRVDKVKICEKATVGLPVRDGIGERVGACTFEPDEKRAAKATYTFEYFKLWQQIVVRKIQNQAQCLRLMGKEEWQELQQMAGKVLSNDSDNREAVAAALYFPALFGNGFFRGSDDPRNAALNYGYAVMRAGIARNLVVHGLEPCIGLHHRSELNNFNLADDLIEPFRPIVDLYAAQNFSKDDDVLTPRQKAGLFNLTNYLVKQAGRRYRVMLSIDRVCTALANSVTAGENLLELPELIPLELHQYE